MFGILSAVFCVLSCYATCPSGTVSVTINDTTYANNVRIVDSDTCPTDYRKTGVLTGGYTIGTAQTLCDNGYYNGSSCVNYSQGNCKDNYINAAINSSTFTDQTNDSCADGYFAFETDYSCSSGYKYTSSGRCARLCSLGDSSSKSIAGRIVSLFATPQTTPFLTVGYNTGKCYISLSSGTTNTDGMNIKINNTTYHAID